MIIFYSLQNIKSEMGPVLTPRTAGPEGSFIGVQGNICPAYCLSLVLPQLTIHILTYTYFLLSTGRVLFIQNFKGDFTVFSGWFSKTRCHF